MSSEGHLPGFDGATGWLNSPPLTRGGPRGKGRARRFLDVHVHQLASHALLRSRVGREVPRSRVGHRRRAHTRVPVRARRRQRPRSREGHEDRVSGRDRQRLPGVARVQQPLLARRIHRRRPRTNPASPIRRGSLRRVRAGDSAVAARRRGRGRRRRSGLRRCRWRRGSSRLDEPGVARDLPRLRANSELRLCPVVWRSPSPERTPRRTR